MKRKNISQTVRQLVYARDGYICKYCLKHPTSFLIRKINKPYRLNVIPIDEDGNYFEIDHIIPYSETQDNSFYNLVTACADCNKRKSNKKWCKPVINKIKI